jgi:hypothetical protein
MTPNHIKGYNSFDVVVLWVMYVVLLAVGFFHAFLFGFLYELFLGVSFRL